jgi:hypothetical protein
MMTACESVVILLMFLFIGFNVGFYIGRRWDYFRGNFTCEKCKKMYTKECPIRVFSRNEGNDITPDNRPNNRDFCSRFERGKHD